MLKRQMKMLVLTLLVIGSALEAYAWAGDRYSRHPEEPTLQNLQTLIMRSRIEDDTTKILLVNRFFNQVPYATDSAVWNEDERWTTPEELLAVGAGDLEDIATAKLLTLKAMGFPSHRMELAVVNHQPSGESYTVLLAYPDDSTQPLVLDYMYRQVAWLEHRSDLMVIMTVPEKVVWQKRDEMKLDDSDPRLVWR
jgi:predicted transglutaminase-like cysteine proteinase